jgi:hypothetical protein
VPFVFYNLGMEMLQQPNSITILYVYDHEVRHAGLNQAHPAHPTPSWFGDSVGHYEGDTLVIDTLESRRAHLPWSTNSARRIRRLCT